jgi:hypothetical protein
MRSTRQGFPKALAALAVAIGIAGGSYGIASAASGNSSSSSSGTSTSTAMQPAPSSQPWGAQRPDETLLTGDAESKVQAAALAKVPGGTVVRVETDADGNAVYEAHMTKSDGTPVTVYVDKSYNVVGVETR